MLALSVALLAVGLLVAPSADALVAAAYRSLAGPGGSVSCTSTLVGTPRGDATGWRFESVTAGTCNGIEVGSDTCTFASGGVQTGFAGGACQSGAALSITGTVTIPEGGTPTVYTHTPVSWTYTTFWGAKTFTGVLTWAS